LLQEFLIPNGGQFNATIVQPNNIDADANDLTALFASMVVGRDTLTIFGLIETPSTTSDYEDLEILNVNPKITISITDSRNPEKTKSTKSQLLQLPIEDNAEILGFVSDYAVNAEQIYDAYLETDLVQIKGKLQILGVDNKSFGVIKTQFLSNNFNWIDQTKTTKVNSLSIPAIEHTLTKAVVDAAVDGTKDYLYPLVDYGQFQVVGGVYVVDVIDRYPAVKVKTILTAIFKAAGYSIEGTYIDGSEFEALFMLFGKKCVYQHREHNNRIFGRGRNVGE